MSILQSHLDLWNFYNENNSLINLNMSAYQWQIIKCRILIDLTKLWEIYFIYIIGNRMILIYSQLIHYRKSKKLWTFIGVISTHSLVLKFYKIFSLSRHIFSSMRNTVIFGVSCVYVYIYIYVLYKVDYISIIPKQQKHGISWKYVLIMRTEILVKIRRKYTFWQVYERKKKSVQGKAKPTIPTR
jgi:hypothetical protein